MTTPNLDLDEWAAGQDQPHVTVNEALVVLDAVVQLSVISDALTTPPGGPSEGDRYIVAATAAGAWLGWEDSIAAFSGGIWKRIIPNTGWVCWVESASKQYKYDAGWSDLSAGVSLPIQKDGAEIVATPVAIDFKGAGVSVTDNAGVAEVTITGGGGAGATDLIFHLREELATTVRPMAGPAGVEDPRNINTIVRNTVVGATLTGDVMHLPEGIYNVVGDAPVYRVGRVRTSLYSVTSSSISLLGQNAYTNATDGAANPGVIGQITVGVGGEDFQVTQWRQYTNSNDDQGLSNSTGEPEIYAQIIFHKVG